MLGVHNPAGADCCKILVLLPGLLAAAQPERYDFGGERIMA
jgi:hypothetical protein